MLVCAVIFHLFILYGLKSEWPVPLFNDARFRTARADMMGTYVAGHRALSGEDVYKTGAIEGVPPYYPFRYLPVYAYAVGVPMNALSPQNAYFAWVALSEFLFLLMIVVVARMIENPRTFAVAASAMLAYSAVFLEYRLGQANVAQALLLVLCVHLLERRSATAVAPWTGAVLWKMNGAILAPAFLKLRQFKAVGICGAVLIAATAPYFIAHPESIEGFRMNFQRLDILHAGNQGLMALFLKVRTIFGLPYFANYIMIALVLACAAWITVKADSKKIFELCALWIAAYFLVYNHVWETHYVMLLPFAAVAIGRERALLPAVALLILLLPTPLYFFVGQIPQAAGDSEFAVGAGLSLAHHLFKPLSAILMFAWAVKRALIPADPSSGTA